MILKNSIISEKMLRVGCAIVQPPYYKVLLLIQFLLYSNGLVALAIALFTAYTIDALGVGQPELILFNVLCTLFAYNFPRYNHIKNYGPSSTGTRAQWYGAHLTFLRNISLVCFVGTLLYLRYLNVTQGMFLSVIALICLFYVAPGPQMKSLRNVPYLKPFIIAFCWIALTLIVPYLASGNGLMWKPALLLKMFSSQYILIFVTAVLFDLRDTDEDRHVGLVTIANRLKTSCVKFICYLFIVARLFLITVPEKMPQELVFSIILTLIVYLAHSKRSDYYFICIVDGSLVLYPTIMLFL